MKFIQKYNWWVVAWNDIFINFISFKHLR
jgi:hypothetical protein